MGIIDVHHHFFPPAYLEEASDILIGGASRGFEHVLEWTPEAALANMDAFGIEKAIVSITAPGVWIRDVAQATKLARQCNEYAARMVTDRPDRFDFFAALPMPNAEAAITELSFAMGELGAVGGGFMTSYGDRWLGDPEFDAVHSMLNDLCALAFVHPVVPDTCHDLVHGVPETMMEFAFDTARAIASLVLNGAMNRTPEVTWIFSHGGGAIPMVVDRLQFAERFFPDAATRFPHGILHELRRLYYDTGSVTNPIPFASAKELAGIGHLLFNTDYPFPPTAAVMRSWEDLVLAPSQRQAIESGNAERLLGEHARRTAALGPSGV